MKRAMFPTILLASSILFMGLIKSGEMTSNTDFALAEIVMPMSSLGSTATATIDIDYTISIVQPESHTMHVRIDVAGLQQSPLELTLHESVAANDIVSNFTATDDIGNPLPIEDCEFKGCCKWVTLNGAENVTIEYDILQDFPDWAETRIDDTHAVIEASRTIYKTRVSEEDVASIDLFLNLPIGWDVLTDLEQIGNRQYRLNSLDEIVDDDFGVARTSVIVAGEMTRRDINFDGVQMRLAIFDKVFEDGFPITMDRFAQVSENLYRFYTDYFGGMTSTSPTIALTPANASQSYGINILTQHYLSILPEDAPYVTYPWNFTHHMAHAWWINALSFEPDSDPRYRLMKEGINSYTNILSLEGAGLWEDYEQAWRWLDPTISRPQNVPDRVKQDFNCYMGVFGTPDDLPLSGAEGHPKDDKGVSLAAVIDHRLALLTDAEHELGDFFAYLFQQNGGYWFNPDYLVDVDTLLRELNAFSGYDFTDFFDRYVYGLELIPYLPYYYYDKAFLAIEERNFGQAELYFTMAYEFAVKLGEDDLAIECEQWIGPLGEDSDADGLSNLWEEHLGTDSQNPDTDGDGLSDRAELGVIIDGKPGEYGLDQPLIEDPPGDSETPEAGTDIKGVYAKTFLNESGDQELYLVLSTWDNQYNPDATYDFSLRTADTLYHYGFNAWWGSGITDVEQELDGGCKDWFEAKIPLNLLDNPDQIMVDGATGVWPGPGHEGHTADQTLDGTFTIPIMPQIFITDPLNPDTDGDGYSDGGEICVGENPLDPDVTLSYLELVRLSLLGNDDRPDTDGDGLVDCVEEYIGTDSQVVDTDEDGLSDREEFGAIVDGQAGEYGLDQPLTEDPQGDSQSSEVGTDIKGMYAKTFLNENGDEELYLVLSTWDNQFNPDAWYEFRMAVASDSYQYRLEGIRSYLWHCEENDPCVDISDGGVDGQFKDWLEVKIPLDLLGNPDQITVRGVTRAGGDPIHGLDDVDYSSDATFTIAPQLFITDPLNLDTDGDGYSDGEEVQAGTNPLDPESHPWFIYLPLVLKASPLEER